MDANEKKSGGKGLPPMMRQMMEKMCGTGAVDSSATCEEMMKEMLGKGGSAMPECCRRAPTPEDKATPDTKDA